MIFTLRPLQLSLQEQIGHSPFYLCLATSASMDNVWNIFSIYILFSFQLDSTCSIWSWLSTLYSLIFAILQLQTLLMSPLFEVWSWNTEAPPWPSCKSTRSKISFTSSVANILPKNNWQMNYENFEKIWKDFSDITSSIDIPPWSQQHVRANWGHQQSPEALQPLDLSFDVLKSSDVIRWQSVSNCLTV